MRTSLFVVALLFVACGPPAKLSEVEAQVFAPSCVFSSCHKGVGAAGLSLEGKTYARIVNVAAVDAPGKILVTPKDLGKSYLYEKLTSDTPAAGVRMPQGATVDAEQLAMVKSWIEAGAKDD